jgi:hypothetical protein
MMRVCWDGKGIGIIVMVAAGQLFVGSKHVSTLKSAVTLKNVHKTT